MMGVSIIDIQRSLLLDALKSASRGEWKVLILDPMSKELVYNTVKEDDILNLQITNIELIHEKRPMNRDMDAIYLLTPEPWLVDCLMADFERRRYRSAHLLWTSLPHPKLRERIDKSSVAREHIKVFRVLDTDYFPRESHLVTFRDPWSFPVLYHPACNNLVREHLEKIAGRIVAVCVSLGEYPTIRYFRPRNASHDAGALCTHLARMVQEQLDMYAQYHTDFPPQSNRPRGALFITDRCMDLVAPFLHEFTYQAMAHDLLPIKDGEKVIYKFILNEGQPDKEEKDAEISETDKIWVENRHSHMKDTIEKLMGDFQKFIDQNPQFTNQDSGNATSLNAIKDMLAGLPEFQSMKEAYSLHLSMAQECMRLFQHQKLPDLASVEQSLATGLDEDYRKPKNLADQVVRTLDEETITKPDRLRLLALYLLYKDGLLPSDLIKLLAHAQLPPQDSEVLHNLELLGARVAKPLRDNKPAPIPLFVRKPVPNAPNQEEYALSRFKPALHNLLEDHVRGGLDQFTFPFVKSQADAAETAAYAQESAQAASSLRSAKPTWAKSRLSSVEPRQRVIVFMAGGATYSESRACYEVSRSTSRDVFLMTSHMLTPGLFLRQVGDLSVDKRRLNIPAEQPPKQAPAHLFEPEPQARPAPPLAGSQRPGGLPNGPAPPMAAMGKINLNSGRPAPNGVPSAALAAAQQASSGKVSKDKDGEPKKKHRFFGSKR